MTQVRPSDFTARLRKRQLEEASRVAPASASPPDPTLAERKGSKSKRTRSSKGSAGSRSSKDLGGRSAPPAPSSVVPPSPLPISAGDRGARVSSQDLEHYLRYEEQLLLRPEEVSCSDDPVESALAKFEVRYAQVYSLVLLLLTFWLEPLA